MNILRLLSVAMCLSLALASQPWPALADEYDDSQSHPLRLVAYLAHPAGLIVEWVFFRPLHVLVSAHPATEYIFGHKPHPPMFTDPSPSYGFGVSRRDPMKETAPPKEVAAQEPTAEIVTVKEVIVERTVVKEVPKIIEVEAERVIFPDVAFRFDSADLTELGKGKAYLVAQKLKERPDLVVVIEGHADYIGSEEYNMRLGVRRAERVKEELRQLGIDPGRLSVASQGESKPVIDQQTDWARAVNRRAEFRVR